MNANSLTLNNVGLTAPRLFLRNLAKCVYFFPQKEIFVILNELLTLFFNILICLFFCNDVVLSRYFKIALALFYIRLLDSTEFQESWASFHFSFTLQN